MCIKHMACKRENCLMNVFVCGHRRSRSGGERLGTVERAGRGMRCGGNALGVPLPLYVHCIPPPRNARPTCLLGPTNLFQ